MIIGIPKALIHWKRSHFWKEFFKGLGFKVLFSPVTNKEIVKLGVEVADPETCFSNKVYWGHLLWLDKKCDLIFVPRLKNKKNQVPASKNKSKETFEYCPKFFGIPDLAKILVKTPILTEVFDEKKEKFEKTLEKIGKKLDKSVLMVKKASRSAFLKEKLEKEKKERNFFRKIKSKKPKIVLVSHPYNLHDDYVNLRIKEKLEKLGVESIFIEQVPISKKLWFNSNTKFHWEFGEEIMEKVKKVLEYKINGAIEISSFACGCDAVLKEFVGKEFKQAKIPFLYLIIDEHTGEAGFQTRLEAFIDTL